MKSLAQELGDKEMMGENGSFENIDQDDFIVKTKRCYNRYGMLPIKYRDKSGVTLDSDDILELALELRVIQKH